MRAYFALRACLSLIVATTARGDTNWNDIHKQAIQAYQDEKLEIAESLFRNSAELARGPKEIGLSANDLGVVLHLRHQDAEARQWLVRSLAEWQRTNYFEEGARTAHALASVQRATGEYRDAEATLRVGLNFKPRNRMTIALLENSLADLLREQGQFAAALEAVTLARGQTGLPWRLQADSEIIMADIERESGQFAASIALWTKTLGEARQNGEANIEAVTLRGLGETQLAAGDSAAAEPSLRKALAMFEDARDSHQIASTLTCLAELYLTGMKPAMAEEVMRRAVDLDEKALGPDHPQLAALLQMRADAASRQGALARALADLDRAWRIVKASFGERSSVGGAFLVNRGIIEQRAGSNQAAAASYARAVEILRNRGPEVRDITATLMTNYAAVLRTLHRKDEARAVLAEARSFR